MKDVPSPIEVTSWPQVAALALLLAAFVIIPAIIGYLQLREAKSVRKAAKEADEKSSATLAAVTQNNGGKSVPDRFDQTDARITEVLDRLDRLEGVPRAVGVAPRPVELEKGIDR